MKIPFIVFREPVIVHSGPDSFREDLHLVKTDKKDRQQEIKR